MKVWIMVIYVWAPACGHKRQVFKVLALVVPLLNLWRGKRSFAAGAFYANVALLAAGLALTAYQLRGYFAS